MIAPTGTSPAASAFLASARARSMYSSSDFMSCPHGKLTIMKIASKIALFLLMAPALALAQPGVRMSADFLPLEVGNRWVYDVFNEAGQKTGALEFAVQEYRIVDGRSFYLLTTFPFVEGGDSIKLVRYDRQERQYMRMVESEEGPLFLADGTRVEV